MSFLYRRIIPPCPPRGEDGRLPAAVEAVFQKHGLVYHMTTTEAWMTVEQVVTEMDGYRESWPDDTTAEECDPEVVRQALEELAAVGLEDVREWRAQRKG